MGCLFKVSMGQQSNSPYPQAKLLRQNRNEGGSELRPLSLKALASWGSE